MEAVYKSWWTAWSEEVIERYTVKPRKWLKDGPELAEGDITVFLKTAADVANSGGIWRLGEIVSVERSSDGKVRRCTLRYKNPEENGFRSTIRPVRSIAKLFSENELELTQQLDMAWQRTHNQADTQEN